MKTLERIIIIVDQSFIYLKTNRLYLLPLQYFHVILMYNFIIFSAWLYGNMGQSSSTVQTGIQNLNSYWIGVAK